MRRLTSIPVFFSKPGQPSTQGKNVSDIDELDRVVGYFNPHDIHYILPVIIAGGECTRFSCAGEEFGSPLSINELRERVENSLIGQQ